MKQKSLLKTMLLLFALIAGSSSMWATTTTLYSWNGNGSTTTANETGGTASAVQSSGSNIAVGVSQKGNYCLKMNKGFSSGAYYIDITLDETLTTGDKVIIGAFRTSSTAATLGVDFGTTATQQTKADTDVIESNGTPTDWEITVPSAANGGNKIRLYRSAGSTGMWVSKVVVTHESSGSGTNASWTLNPTSATVTAGQSTTLQLTTNYDGTLNFASNNTGVATVSYNSSTKVVTVNGVAAGSTTISVTGDATATYNAINKAISVTVNHAELESNITDVMGDFGYSYFGLTPSGSDAFAQPEVTSTSKTDAYGVTIAFAKADGGTYPRYDASYMRFYKDNTLTVTAPSGSYITKIVFTEPASGAKWEGSISVETGDYDSSTKTWYATSTGVTSLVLTGTTGTSRIGGLKVYMMATSLPITIATSGYSTLATPCGLDFASATPAGLEAYVASAVTASGVTLAAVDEAPASTGVILKGTAGATYTIPVKAGAAAVGTNYLKAAVTATACAANEVYILKGGKFCKVTAASTVPAGKAYLLASDVPASAPELEFNFGGTTGINSVDSGQVTVNSSEVYNLAGQRVAQPSKGLYIVNGKKVVIK